MRLNTKFLLPVAIACIAGGCATMSPASRIESQFVSLGISKPRATCLSEELDRHLDRKDLNDVADFLEGLNRAQSPGGALDALLRIDNPQAAAAIASAGISCALGRE